MAALIVGRTMDVNNATMRRKQNHVLQRDWDIKYMLQSASIHDIIIFSMIGLGYHGTQIVDNRGALEIRKIDAVHPVCAQNGNKELGSILARFIVFTPF